jgi:hypothetical protein
MPRGARRAREQRPDSATTLPIAADSRQLSCRPIVPPDGPGAKTRAALPLERIVCIRFATAGDSSIGPQRTGGVPSRSYSARMAFLVVSPRMRSWSVYADAVVVGVDGWLGPGALHAALTGGAGASPHVIGRMVR